MLRKRKGAEALASTDSEGESARPTPSKKEKPTVSDCDEEDIPLIKPRMPEPRIPDVDDDTPLFPAKGKRKSGIPVVDDDAPLIPAMKKVRDNEEQREEKIMYHFLDLKWYNLVRSLRGRLPGSDVMDIRHTKSQRFVFDNLRIHSKIDFPSASILNRFVI
jgi:hypothetical protein